MTQNSTGVSPRSCRAGKEDTCLASSELGTSPLWEGDHYLIRPVHVSLSRCWVTLLLTTPSEQPLRSHSIDFSLIGGEVTVDVSPSDGADARARWEKRGKTCNRDISSPLCTTQTFAITNCKCVFLMHNSANDSHCLVLVEKLHARFLVIFYNVIFETRKWCRTLFCPQEQWILKQQSANLKYRWQVYEWIICGRDLCEHSGWWNKCAIIELPLPHVVSPSVT